MIKKRYVLGILSLGMVSISVLGFGIVKGFKQESILGDFTKTPIAAPELSLDNETGIISWEPVECAGGYCYYINGGDLVTTNETSVQLNDGESISVMALAQTNAVNTSSSSWSKPISYIDIDESYKYVNVAFRDAPGLEMVTHHRGHPFKLPNNPSKGNYVFDGWYKDPFFKEPFADNTVISEPTVLYAKWIVPSYLNGYYFIKCNKNITNAEKGYKVGDVSEDAWGYIPLHYDASRSAELGNRTTYVAYVSTSESTSSGNPAEYIITDGIDDLGDRKYWKAPNNANFTCNSAGTWRISFSIEYQWDFGGQGYVNAYLDGCESQLVPLSLTRKLLSSELLNTPNLSLDKDNNKVSWSAIDGAEGYEYIIDNGNKVQTTSTEVMLYQGQSIVARAIHSNDNYSSKWSSPMVFNYQHKPEPLDAIVTFFNTDIPSIKQALNTTITRPVDPTKSGYTFDNWYTDFTYKTVFDFNTIISKNVCLYGKWNELEDINRYKLLSPKGTEICDIPLNKGQTSFNEYYAIFTVPSGGTGTYKVIDSLDNNRVLYTHYIDDEVAEYQICFSFDHLYDNGKFATINHTRYNLYFTNTLDTNHDVYAYYWSNSVSGRSVSWPGVKMTWVKKNSYSQDIWMISLYKNYYEYIIFNNHGNGLQTIDISLANAKDKTQWYLNGEKDSSGHFKVASTTFTD